MKKSPFLFLLSFSLLASSLEASELAPEGTFQRKLQRGFLNIAFAPVEISYALAKVKTKDWLIPSAAVGVVEGISRASLRALTGAYDLLTFPFPFPSDYQPVLQPEWALERLGPLKNGS